MRDIEYERRMEIEGIEDGDHQATISMQMIPKNCEFGFLDDQWDADGDSIVVRPVSRFLDDVSARVVAEFARGTAPEMVSRVLRKFADMLDSSHGYQITNLDYDDAEYSEARRLTNGGVLLVNLRREFEEYKREKEDDDVDEP